MCQPSRTSFRSRTTQAMVGVAVLFGLGIPMPAVALEFNDSTAPEVTGITLSATAVDVSDGPVSIAVTVTATDDLSGVEELYLAYASPGNTQRSYVFLSRSSGTATDGTWTGTLVIPQHALAGTWELVEVVIIDKTGNYPSLEEAFVADLKSAISVPTVTVAVSRAPRPAVPEDSSSSSDREASRGMLQRESGMGGMVSVDGVTAPLPVEIRQSGVVEGAWGGGSFALSGAASTSPAGSPNLRAGSTPRIEIDGPFVEGTVIEVWLLSTPRLVAAGRVDSASGPTIIDLPIGAPLDGRGVLPSGPHVLRVVGTTDSGVFV